MDNGESTEGLPSFIPLPKQHKGDIAMERHRILAFYRVSSKMIPEKLPRWRVYFAFFSHLLARLCLMEMAVDNGFTAPH